MREDGTKPRCTIRRWYLIFNVNGDAGHIGTGHFLGSLRFFSNAFLYLKLYR